jgi:glucose/arabinose dehydrogenase
MSIRRFSVVFAVLGLTNVGLAQSLSDPLLSYTTLSTPGISQPTALRFLGPDDFFVIEKASGKVKRYTSGSVTEVLDLPVNSISERGGLGLELHPDFPDTPWVYAYYSRADGNDDGSWLENRLSRFTWDGTSLSGETPLLQFESVPGGENGPNHNGGPIVFGPDGMLYGVIGDLNRNGAEQNNPAQAGTSADAGGIYRLRDDGSIPDGSVGGETANPLLNEANSDFHKWFAYGVRNSFGMAFDPATGSLWDTENGVSDFDEINRVEAGFNSGWRPIMGPESESPNSVGDLVMLDGASYSDPEFSWRNTIGVTSIQFLVDSILGPAYDDDVLVGDNNTRALYLLTLNDNRDGFDLEGALSDGIADSTNERNALRIGTDFGVVTDIQVGPDGGVYVLSLSNNAVYRITPEPGSAAMLALAVPMLLRRRRKRVAG